jgi:hypothetical protein
MVITILTDALGIDAAGQKVFRELFLDRKQYLHEKETQ